MLIDLTHATHTVGLCTRMVTMLSIISALNHIIQVTQVDMVSTNARTILLGIKMVICLHFFRLCFRLISPTRPRPFLPSIPAIHYIEITKTFRIFRYTAIIHCMTTVAWGFVQTTWGIIIFAITVNNLCGASIFRIILVRLERICIFCSTTSTAIVIFIIECISNVCRL